MGSDLKTRIERRLLALNLNPTQLDKLAGITVGFTRDFLQGRKEQPRASNLAKIAEALECDLDYLLLKQRAPRKGGVPEDGLLVLGICEAGTWREADAIISNHQPTPYDADPRYPEEEQGIYFVRDSHAAGLGIAVDAIVIAVSKGAAEAKRGLRAGDVVVIKRERPGGMFETTIAQLVEGKGALRAVRRGDRDQEIEGEWEVVALALTAIQHLA